MCSYVQLQQPAYGQHSWTPLLCRCMLVDAACLCIFSFQGIKTYSPLVCSQIIDRLCASSHYRQAVSCENSGASMGSSISSDCLLRVAMSHKRVVHLPSAPHQTASTAAGSSSKPTDRIWLVAVLYACQGVIANNARQLLLAFPAHHLFRWPTHLGVSCHNHAHVHVNLH